MTLNNSINQSSRFTLHASRFTHRVSRFLREPTLWLALLIGLVALLVGYQRPVSADIGGQFDTFLVRDFHAPEQYEQATYRWSTAQSSLVLRGVGKPLTSLPIRLQLSSGRGPGSPPLEVGVAVNGHPAPSLNLTSESASYTVIADPSWIDFSGDVVLDFSSPTFRPSTDKRDLGFIVDFVQIEYPVGLTIPSLSQLLWLLSCGILLYVSLRLVRLAAWPSGVATLLLLLASAAFMAFGRLLLTVFTTRMLVTLLLALLVALFAEGITRWLVGVAGWKGERALPEWAWVGLRGLVLITAILKIGGILYPHSFIIDADFHLKYINFAAEGKPYEEYFGRSLSFAVMPKHEWGAATAFIPYSPFLYFAASPLAKLPLPISITVPVAAAILESLKVALVFLLGLALGPARNAARRAVSSAAVFAFIPPTFLLLQWGNWPTSTSIWLVTFWATITCLFWARLTHPLIWAVSALTLALAMLCYTVTAAYIGVFVGMLVVCGWLFAPGDRKRWLSLGLALGTAALISLLVFYGQYIDDMITETLPTFGQAVEEQGKLTTLRPTFGGFITGSIARAMQSYNLIIIYAMGLAGAILMLGNKAYNRVSQVAKDEGRKAAIGKEREVYRIVANLNPDKNRAVLRHPHPTASPYPWQRVWLAAWLLCFPLFTLLDFYVDQVLKEFWFALPAIAVVSGIWLLSLLGRRLRIYTLLVWLIGAVLVWQSLSLWVFRLLFHNR